MIEKMKKLYIYSPRSQSAEILEEVMKCGAVQMEKTQSMLPEDTADGLIAAEGIDYSDDEAFMVRINDCISAVKPYNRDKGILRKRTEVSFEELIDDRVLKEAAKVCDEIEQLTEEIKRLNEGIKEVQFRRTSYIPWRTMKLMPEDMETRKCRIACCILKEPGTIESLNSYAEKNGIGMYAQEIFTEKYHHYIAVVFLKRDERKVREAVSMSGGKEFSVDKISGTFSDCIISCDLELERLNREVESREKQMSKVAGRIRELQTASDAVRVRLQLTSVQDCFMHTDKVDVITGWIPASGKDEVAERLNRFDCYCEYYEPDKDDEFPVLLKNSKIVEPFGAITEMYSMPSSRSIDTNWAIGMFFFIFFGMMLSDAGYGIVLTAGGLLGARYLHVGEEMKRLMKMIGIAGISTIIWGAIYGSWFGDAVPVIAKTYLGKTIEIPRIIDPLNDPMGVLILSCAIGVIHLFTGMAIKAYIMIKRGDLFGAIFDVGLWYIFLTGLVLFLMPGQLGEAGKLMSVLGALGLILTQGRHKPTIAGRLISGIMSLYNVTSYFSDVLSYSRILALGLATGVIASVVNILASMAGSSIIGAVLFTAIFVFGHILNMSINALGAYVHSARLQYVEFFGKYYEGGGNKFTPLKIRTEYVRVTEEK